MQIYNRWTSIIALLGLAALAPMASGQSVNARQDRQIRRELRLEQYRIQRIETVLEKDATIRIPVNLDGTDVELSLAPNSVRSWKFEVYTTDATGESMPYPLPPETTYGGRVLQWPGSKIAASIIDGRLSSVLIRDVDEIWGIQPLTEIDPKADPNLYVSYRQSDVIAGPGMCGTDETFKVEDDAPWLAKSALGPSQCDFIAEIAFEADVEFYELNGSSVINTVADIEAVVNGVNLIYQNDVLTTHVITRIIVSTVEPDGLDLTDSSDLLAQFRFKWNTSHHPTSGDPIDRDIAHLMTGKELDGNIIGVAYFPGLCSNLDTGFGYGLSESRSPNTFVIRVALTAHELGHNWNAGHCDSDGLPDCGIMCSIIGSCDVIPDAFGLTSRTAISSFRDTSPCLDIGSTVKDDCNINCIDDTQEILDGISLDCNVNGIPDDCDIDSGLSGDCDLNGIPDICEDCDGNGLADACDISAVFDESTGQLSPFGFFTDVAHTFFAPPNALGDVTLTFNALGKLNLNGDTVDVTLNGFVIGTFFDGEFGANCPTVSGPHETVLTASAYNTMVNGGDAIFNFHTEGQFLPTDPDCLPNPWVSMDISYAKPNLNDGNGNGILDVCECEADCHNAGPDTLVNVNDLLELLANWGTSPSFCDIDPPGGDGEVNVNDLLTFLAAWGGCAP